MEMLRLSIFANMKNKKDKLKVNIGFLNNCKQISVSKIPYVETAERYKSLYTQQKKLSSLTRGWSLLIFTANQTIANLRQYELSQEDSDLLKAGLHFSIQPDKIRKWEIFTKIHRSLLTTLYVRKPKVR